MHVAMTDDDTAMKNALTELYPDVQQQLCIWHIEKNVYKNVKEKWNTLPEDDPATLRPSENTSPAGTEERPSRNQVEMEALLSDWKEITNAKTLDEYSSKRAEFCSRWESEQPGIYHLPSP